MTRSHDSDPALVQACLSRDQAAWDTLVDRYTRLVYSIPRRYGLSEPDADDVHQNVFGILAEKLAHLKDQSRLSSWLITTAHRECWKLKRRTGEPTALQNGDPVDERLPDKIVEQLEKRQLIRRGLQAVGSPCRELLEALFLQTSPSSYEAIAERLGMKMGSIGPTRARCLEKLAIELRDLGLDEGEG